MPVEGERAQHDPNAGASPDRKTLESSKDSFPASDALGTRVETGARAVPPAELMDDPDSAPREPEDAVEIALTYPDREAAKLALERAVREGPVERRLAEIATAETSEGAEAAEAAPATLRLRVPADRAGRVEAMLREAGGGDGHEAQPS